MARLMYMVIAATFLLSTADGVLTAIEVENGWATESNPFMGFFLSVHPFIFMTVKSIMMIACMSVLWHARNKLFAQTTACLSLTLYAGIVGWHTHGLMNLV